MACLLNHWRNPVSSNTAYLDEAYRLSTASGDLHYASYALTQQTIVAVHTGEPLDDIFKKAAGYLEFTRRIQYEDITPYFVVARQWVACLRGETVSPAGFGTTDFDDAAYRVALDASTFAAPRGWYWLMRLEAATLARNTAEAVDLIDRLHPLLYALTGQLLEADYWFYSALALCALPVPGMTPRHRKHLRTAQKKLRQWAAHCPANYQHTSLLIDAEIARRSGKSAEALAEYERSIAAAREHGFPHAEAIATEWAGRFHAAENRPAIALLYLREAHRGYRRWGATVLARRIEIELPAVREPEPSGEEQRTATQSTSTTEALQGTLDLLTVLKASQALSESIDLQRVLERMMRVVMENAGADRGLFIVEQGGALVIEAEGSLHDHALSVLQSRPVVANDWYADAVIRYVARSKAPIVLHGPVREGPFAGDPHIHPERTFSLLCTPIVRQGKLNGILYLENTLLSGAFTRERMEVLRLLSAQIAISIENARLYEQEKMLARMHEQVRLAADIQLDLLPKASPAVPGYTLAGRNLPAQLVGGDYFDYLPIDEGRIALCLGDVSGKGLPASLLMANLQATLRAQTALNDSPGSCMRRANTLLHRSTSPEKFATLFYGILDFREHTLWFSNAGHEQPMLLDGRDPLTPLDAGGPPLAMLEDYPYADGRVVLAPEALLVVYSDGVPEAMNRAGEQFGHDRLHAVIRDHSTAEPAALIEAIIEKIHDHAEGAEQSDDITLLVVRRQPAGETIADHPPR
jgi:serine phosphatase RsbU (regulator of sigma subunit)